VLLASINLVYILKIKKTGEKIKMKSIASSFELQNRLRKANAWFQALVLLSAGILPLLLSAVVSKIHVRSVF
jgi:hypothetical protein